MYIFNNQILGYKVRPLSITPTLILFLLSVTFYRYFPNYHNNTVIIGSKLVVTHPIDLAFLKVYFLNNESIIPIDKYINIYIYCITRCLPIQLNLNTKKGLTSSLQYMSDMN
jgi:hypothetical protein